MERRPGAGTTAGNRAHRDYVRIADIASGGVGHVALALKREGSFERLYAVKRLHAEHRNDEDFRTMFFDEARLAGLVRHSNVVSVIDVGEDEQGPFLVMDYVEGVPLSALVKHAKRSGTEVPLQVALRIVIEAARGLHAAHEVVGPDGTPLHLVHRDVSPQNILIGFDGVTRVTDFGVAKAFGRTTQTVTGVLKGKLGYMAPEQLRFQELDRRADIFALGVVFYELLVGDRLYRSVAEYDGVRRILEEAPPDVGVVREDAPPRLVELIFSMLAKKPELRPATAMEVSRVLDAILADVEAADGKIDVAQYINEAFAAERETQSSRARLRPPPESVPPPAGRDRTRSRWLAVAGVAALLLIVATGFAWLRVGSDSAETRDEPGDATSARTDVPIAPPPPATPDPVADVQDPTEPTDAVIPPPPPEVTDPPEPPVIDSPTPTDGGHRRRRRPVKLWRWQR